jgi:hypothetical protein
MRLPGCGEGWGRRPLLFLAVLGLREGQLKVTLHESGTWCLAF